MMHIRLAVKKQQVHRKGVHRESVGTSYLTLRSGQERNGKSLELVSVDANSPAKTRVSTALPVEMLCGSSFMSTVGRCKMFAVKMSRSMLFTRLKKNVNERLNSFFGH